MLINKMSFLRALRGHKVEKQDDINSFLNYYYHNNYLVRDDADANSLKQQINQRMSEIKYIKTQAHHKGQQEAIKWNEAHPNSISHLSPTAYFSPKGEDLQLIQEKENEIQTLTSQLNQIKERYALKQGQCYKRFKIVNGKEESKVVGTLKGVKLMTFTETTRWKNDEDGDEVRASYWNSNWYNEVDYHRDNKYYWLVEFSNGTVTYKERVDDLRKWFSPCDPKPNAKTRKGRKQRRQTRKTR